MVSDELGTGGAIGTLNFTVQLINNNTFTVGGQDVTFGFDLAGNPTITYSNLDTTQPDPQWTVVGGTGAGNLTQAAGTLHADGFGDVEYGVKLEGSGASGTPPNVLTFSISGVDLNFADLETIMVADIFSGTTGFTGFVDFTGNLVITPVDVNGTPIPGAVWLFGGGLGLVAMLGGRRKRKQKSVWEVTQNA